MKLKWIKPDMPEMYVISQAFVDISTHFDVDKDNEERYALYLVENGDADTRLFMGYYRTLKELKTAAEFIAEKL